jgi:hypothetical protein
VIPEKAIVRPSSQQENSGRLPREFGCFEQYDVETFKSENGRSITARRSTAKDKNLRFLWLQ